ncbi:hypothetical protein [Paenibacillus radicis (ex Xue et al. 2023)]|uniref:Uncharacterized protein n=1 Tax=Paenibacillus radicis (ex Xue et al. 2023) TaxID=2972489 RepID=A0ABT1YV67_9BACL|nr:hypothetical protein [Paenibacillus radicis (ex Xue et al. 2023)]MCR8636831.1 hypothetical protein [Paenibacillus radicis (ex Xue et al. 2023)]
MKVGSFNHIMTLLESDKGGVIVKLLKDNTLLDLAEIISKALGRDSINKITVRTGLFTMVDVEDDFSRHSSKELLTRHIISTFSEVNLLTEKKVRQEFLLLIDAFYKRSLIAPRKE